MSQGKIRTVVAILAGMAFIFVCDYLLGAKLEIFSGLDTFTPIWVLDVFVVSFISGMIVSRIVRSRMGKWVACLPPFFVRCLSYLYMYLYVYNDGKDFFYHLNLYYWGPTVILVVEFANLGGILGDVLAGAYQLGRKPQQAPAPTDSES